MGRSEALIILELSSLRKKNNRICKPIHQERLNQNTGFFGKCKFISCNPKRKYVKYFLTHLCASINDVMSKYNLRAISYLILFK